jgi:transposase
MQRMVPRPRLAVKQRLLRHLRQCRNAGLRTRYLVILNLWSGRAPHEAADVLHVHRATVYRVAQRFREQGEVGLLDRREDNGTVKLDERYLALLYRLVRPSPRDHGWRRPTWTREMLVETMRRPTGVRVHVATLSRALHRLRARRGRRRPTVRCPWSEWAKGTRLAGMRHLRTTLPRDAVAVYEDEVDIHLNPTIGLDWMARGQQKEVVTPGQNAKRYVAGALDVRSGRLGWVEAAQKNSDRFIALLVKLWHTYPQANVISVILDNDRIPSGQVTQAALRQAGGRIRLVFLPPYCPEHNRVERVWEDLHANVTRNHRCSDMASLMCEVRYYLRRYNRNAQKRRHRQAA